MLPIGFYRKTLMEIIDYTDDGKCSNCGSCCSDLLPLSDDEIKRIGRYVQGHRIKEQVRRYPTADPMIDFTCPFRNNDERRCEIYQVRPAICRDFQCDKPREEILADKAWKMETQGNRHVSV